MYFRFIAFSLLVLANITSVFAQSYDNGGVGSYLSNQQYAPPPYREAPYTQQYFTPQERFSDLNQTTFGDPNSPQAHIRHQPGATNLPHPSTAPYNSQTITSRSPAWIEQNNKTINTPSPLEAFYSERIVDEVQQYGYDLFSSASQSLYSPVPHSPMGAVGDDFILGSGDELEIVFTGQRSERGIYRINSRGQLIIEDFPPIPAAGTTMAHLRQSVENAAAEVYNTQAFVSLANIRQIGVLIVGHVKKPGRQNMTSFHSVLDALGQAGGIEKTGSLRQIKLVRDGRTTIIDLYALLLNGASNVDFTLKDGDRIIVPPLGPTVAVAGEVKRPGIFELQAVLQGMHHKPEDRALNISLNELLELSGGVLSPGKNRMLRLGITSDGQELVDEIQDPFAPAFGDGAILMVSKGNDKRAGTVELVGHTRRPGLHALSENKTLAALISSDDVVGQDIYPLIGVIERWDTNQLATTLIDFPLRLVLNGQFDRQLKDGDIIHLFSNEQIANLNRQLDFEKQQKNKHAHNEFEDEAPIQTRFNPHSSNAFPNGGPTYSQSASLKHPQSHQQYYNYQESGSRADTDMTIISDELIFNFLTERAAFVRGAVRQQGHYPIAEGVTLDSLLAVAGGMTLEASDNNIEVTSALQGEGLQTNGRSGTRRSTINLRNTSAKNVAIAPGDAVRVNQKFQKIKDNSVLLIGEVKNPGRYDLLPGDKVSDLLSRAGGVTKQAYPPGGIFSRESERKAEEARFRAQAQNIKRSVALAIETDDEKLERAQINEALALAHQLEGADGVGRITVELDPAILAVKPEVDMLLEEGDRIYIPKRTLNVRVRGEVLSPSSLQFEEGKDPIDYIHEAGGFTYHADKSRTFVLYPDGSAQPLQVSAWNHSATFIPPGSTIIVPRDPKPFDFVDSFKDVTDILANLAITAVFIDDVRNEDD